jgi:hypothetical protein
MSVNDTTPFCPDALIFRDDGLWAEAKNIKGNEFTLKISTYNEVQFRRISGTDTFKAVDSYIGYVALDNEEETEQQNYCVSGLLFSEKAKENISELTEKYTSTFKQKDDDLHPLPEFKPIPNPSYLKSDQFKLKYIPHLVMILLISIFYFVPNIPYGGRLAGIEICFMLWGLLISTYIDGYKAYCDKVQWNAWKNDALGLGWKPLNLDVYLKEEYEKIRRLSYKKLSSFQKLYYRINFPTEYHRNYFLSSSMLWVFGGALISGVFIMFPFWR